MKIYRDIEQRSREWFEIRKLKFTASNATAIRANGKGLETLAKELVRDYYSSRVYEEYSNDINNKHLYRGCKYEDMARSIYEMETGNKVETVAFVEKSKYVGCSPDGLVGLDGLLEIKNPDDKVFFDYVLSGKLDTSHYNQMQMQLYVTDRKWCDYFVFNPNFTPNYVLKTIYRDDAAIAQIAAGLNAGEKLLKKLLSQIEGKLEEPTVKELV